METRYLALLLIVALWLPELRSAAAAEATNATTSSLTPRHFRLEGNKNERSLRGLSVVDECSNDNGCATFEFCKRHSAGNQCVRSQAFRTACSRNSMCRSGICYGGFCTKICKNDDACAVTSSVAIQNDPNINSLDFVCDQTLLPYDEGLCVDPQECEPNSELEVTCGTPTPTDCAKALINLIAPGTPDDGSSRRRRTTANTYPDYDFSKPGPNDFSSFYPIKIRTRVFVVKGGPSTGGCPSSTVRDMIDHVNQAFADAGAPFLLNHKSGDRIVYEDEPSWHYFSSSNINVMRKFLRMGGPQALNIYLGDASSLNVLGLSTFPYQLLGGAEAQARDGILLHNPHNLEANDKEELFWTLVHEVGHWLGLFHTFHTTSCSTDGDQVSDTPVQKCPGWDNQGWRNCFKNTDPINTCGTQDGQCSVDNPGGCDPVWNFMDYSHRVCMKDYGHFTKKQIERMITHYYFFRHQNYDYVYPGTRRERRQLTAADSAQLGSCASGLSEQCDCNRDCFNQAFWPLFKLAGVEDRFVDLIHAQCSNCVSDNDCGPNQYCGMEIGRYGKTCRKKLHQDAKRNLQQDVECFHDNMCLSGYCRPKSGLSKDIDCTNSRKECVCSGGSGDECNPGDGVVSKSNCIFGDCPESQDPVCPGPGDDGNLGILGATCKGDEECFSHICKKNDAAVKVCTACQSDHDCEEKSSGSRYCNKHGLCKMKRSRGDSCRGVDVESVDDSDTCLRGSCQVDRTTRRLEEARSNNSDRHASKTNKATKSQLGFIRDLGDRNPEITERKTECVDCLSDDECDGYERCHKGQCVVCLVDEDCPDPASQYCTQDGEKPECVAKKDSGIGVACKEDNECLSNHCVYHDEHDTRDGRKECALPCTPQSTCLMEIECIARRAPV